MALPKAGAVVIGRRALGESDRRVDFYTREYGKVRGIARAARRPRSRFGSALELFTLGEMVFFDSGRSELVQVDHFDIVRSFVGVREHLERLGQGAWAVEVVARMTADRDPQPALFGLLVRTLATMERTARPARAAVCFGLRAVDLLGHRPRIDRCMSCGRLHPFEDPALDLTAARRSRPGVKAEAVPPRPAPPRAASAEPLPQWRGLAPLVCVLVTVTVFWPVLGHQFLDWDDALNLVDNPEFRGLGWHNLRWMFTTTLAGHWIPVTWLSFGLDHRLWGMNPLGYHLTNVLLHTAAAVVFYLVGLRLLRAATGAGEGALRLGALAAALVFAIHPLRVESVAWATERPDALSGLCFLRAILLYLKAAGPDGAPRRWWLPGSLVG